MVYICIHKCWLKTERGKGREGRGGREDGRRREREKGREVERESRGASQRQAKLTVMIKKGYNFITQ